MILFLLVSLPSASSSCCSPTTSFPSGECVCVCMVSSLSESPQRHSRFVASFFRTRGDHRVDRTEIVQCKHTVWDKSRDVYWYSKWWYYALMPYKNFIHKNIQHTSSGPELYRTRLYAWHAHKLACSLSLSLLLYLRHTSGESAASQKSLKYCYKLCFMNMVIMYLQRTNEWANGME